MPYLRDTYKQLSYIFKKLKELDADDKGRFLLGIKEIVENGENGREVLTNLQRIGGLLEDGYRERLKNKSLMTFLNLGEAREEVTNIIERKNSRSREDREELAAWENIKSSIDIIDREINGFRKDVQDLISGAIKYVITRMRDPKKMMEIIDPIKYTFKQKSSDLPASIQQAIGEIIYGLVRSNADYESIATKVDPKQIERLRRIISYLNQDRGPRRQLEGKESIEIAYILGRMSRAVEKISKIADSEIPPIIKEINNGVKEIPKKIKPYFTAALFEIGQMSEWKRRIFLDALRDTIQTSSSMDDYDLKEKMRELIKIANDPLMSFWYAMFRRITKSLKPKKIKGPTPAAPPETTREDTSTTRY